MPHKDPEKRKAYDKKYHQKNKEVKNERSRKYNQENKEKKRAYDKKYKQENKEKISKQQKEYREKNKEELKAYDKKYRQENKEKISKRHKIYHQKNKKAIKQRQKEYREENKEALNKRHKEYYQKNKESLNKQKRKYLNEYYKKKYKTSPTYKFSVIIKKRIHKGLKNVGHKKQSSSEKLLGCSFEEAHSYITSLFKEGMTWKNHGYRGWHIDHVVPIASFNLADPEEQKKCFHYTNLQPLWAEENLKKGSKILNDTENKTTTKKANKKAKNKAA
jgi:hypothetical protein